MVLVVGLACDFLQFHRIVSKQLAIVINLVSGIGMAYYHTVPEYIHEIWHHLITLLSLADKRRVSIGIFKRISCFGNHTIEGGPVIFMRDKLLGKVLFSFAGIVVYLAEFQAIY